MSTYPIKIVKKSLDHQGGTKSYHIVEVITADGRLMLVKRWGKKGSFGSIDVITGGATTSLGGGATTSLGVRILRDKQKRGYDEVDHKELKANDLEEFKRLMTPRLYTSLGANNIAYLIPDAETTGIKEPEKIEWEEDADGKRRLKQKAPMPLPSPPEPTIEEKIARNPLWGAF